MKLIYLSEALRMFRHALRVKRKGYFKYAGSEEQIAKQIIEQCWNKNGYFQVSGGHFNEFYSRDFGLCAEALVSLGYKKRVHRTLEYVLGKFKKHGHMTTSISPGGVCFDFPCYAVDSLPFMIHAISVSGADEILLKNMGFIKSEIDYFLRNVFDKKRCLVRKDRFFSSIKDYSERRSSCYDNCMLFMLKEDLSKLGFYNPLIEYDVSKAIMDNFWNGSYFFEDTDHRPIITGDSNVFPFWCGVTRDPHIFKSALECVKEAELLMPFPMRYSGIKENVSRMNYLEIFAGGYERDVIWVHLGLCFLDVLKGFDDKSLKVHLDSYARLMDKHKNFLEVYGSDGKPFSTKLYVSDESMLWVAKYMVLKSSR